MSSPTTTPVQFKSHENKSRPSTHSAFKVNFSLLSFHGQRYPHTFEIIVILIEYLQLISQTLLFRTDISEDPDLDAYSLMCKVFVYAARLINPSYLLSFPAQDSLIKTVLCLVIACMLIKYFIFFYVVWISAKNKRGSAFLINIWKFIFKLQGRIFYYLLSSFWLNTIIAASQSKDDYFGMDPTITILISSILAVLEFVFTFYLNIFYCYLLPTKNFSAAKDNHLELISLLQKFIIQIFQVSLLQNKTATDWTLTVASLTFCLLRDRRFFATLPLYNLRSLTFQAILLALVTSLNLSSFLQVLIKSFTFPQADIRLILVLWTIIALMGIFIFMNMLNKTVISICIKVNSNLSSPKLLIHKIRLLKYLRKIKRLPTPFNDKYQFEDLILTTANISLGSLDLSKNSATEQSLHIKESADSIFAYYLDHLLQKYPQDSFIKLYLAYHSSKKHKAYGKAMKMVAELQQKASTSIISLNSSLLAHEVQDIIRKEYENSQNTSVDLSAYIKNQIYLDDLKKYMLAQADLQIKMCQEMSQDVTDLIKVWDFAISANQHRQVLERKIQKMTKIVSEENIEPLLLCANYQLTLNNSVHEYLAYHKAYTKKLHTYEKSFLEQTLIQENIYQEGNAFIIISGQKPDAGKILYCNRQTKNLLGGDEQSYIGTNIASIFLPKTDVFSDQFYKAIIEGGDIHNLTNIVRAYIHHKEGYMIEADYYINIHPNITKGLHLSIIIRPVPTRKDHIIVLENGDIEGMTFKLCRKLRLLKNFHPNSRKPLNISSLSFELMRVNRAFSALSQVKKTSLFEVINKNRRKNFVRLATTHENSTKLLIDEESSDDLNPATNHHQVHEHKEVYSTYSVEGAEVTLHSFDSNNVETYTYHCKAKNLNFTSTSVLLLTLEEAQRTKKDSPSFDLQKLFTTTNNQKLFSTNNVLSEEKFPQNESINEYSITLQVEDEKQGGWIDLKLLQSGQRDKLELYSKREFTRLDKIDETDKESLVSPKSPKSFGFLNSLRSQAAPLISMASPGRLHRKITTVNNKLFTTQVSQILPAAGRSSETGQITSSQEQNGVNKAMVGSMQTSQISKKSTHKRISKVIKLALETKNYSRTFQTACGFFYFLILCMLACQVYLKVTIGNTTSLLDTKKNILINAQLRAYQLTNIQSIFRQMEDLSTGRLTEADLGLVARPLSTYIGLSQGYLEDLIELNREILTSISALNQETRASLFYKDVKVYETKTDPTGTVYTLMTNFEATQRITESALKELQDCATNTTHTLEEFNFVSRNSINDLYFKNNDISDLFLESVQNQITSIQDEITIYLILEFVLLIILCATVLYAVRQQYLKETKYMTAFVKPANKEILTMIHNLNIFKREIENQKENSFDQRLRTDELAPYSKHLSKQSTSPSYNKFSVKRESMRATKHLGIQKKYFVYLLRWFLLTAALIALIIWNSILAKVSIQYTQTKVTQLDFTYRMETSIDLAVVVASELPIGNGTTIIQNVPTSTGIGNSIKVVQDLITQVTQVIGRSDLGNAPEIDTILFSDTCQFLDSSFFQYYCTILKEKAIGTSFLQLLSELESLLTKRQENFFNSDRSATALKTVELIDYDIIIAVKRGLLGGTAVLGDLINADFEDYSNRTNNQRTIIFGLFTGYLAILVFSAWCAVLKKINEGDNDFKKVLKSLPPELILPNYILKSFLLKTSQGIIDTVKDDV